MPQELSGKEPGMDDDHQKEEEFFDTARERLKKAHERLDQAEARLDKAEERMKKNAGTKQEGEASPDS
jgi:hypothetical protein